MTAVSLGQFLNAGVFNLKLDEESTERLGSKNVEVSLKTGRILFKHQFSNKYHFKIHMISVSHYIEWDLSPTCHHRKAESAYKKNE